MLHPGQGILVQWPDGLQTPATVESDSGTLGFAVDGLGRLVFGRDGTVRRVAGDGDWEPAQGRIVATWSAVAGQRGQ